MDIDCSNFRSQLPSILQAISRSRFVSFDLELSGIPTRQHSRARNGLKDDGGKQTLQQRYTETKTAAERFQILQLGLTCVEEDHEQGLYVMRPYNFFLDPVPDRKLKIERDITYQSGAVQFLLDHNFRMDVPFVRGVSFLSFREESAARTIAEADWARETVADISISPEDIENLQLMRRARQEIGMWRQQTTAEPSFLNIAPAGHGEPGYNGRGLNRYQKRLVHQLVRAEYPDLVSISKFDFIQIIPYDREREEAQLKRKKQGLENTLTSQIGLRWVIQALCSNIEAVLSDDRIIPPLSGAASQATLNSGPSPAIDIGSSEGLRYLVSQVSKPTLVGHNLFLDLIYLYACFFGPLPDDVEEFQAIMGTLFPLIIDTKYLADSANQNSPQYRSSLEELDDELSKIPSPVIEFPPEYNKYLYTSAMHEAGFDSYLTAKNLIRLSAKLDGHYKSVSLNRAKIKEPDQRNPPSHSIQTFATSTEEDSVARVELQIPLAEHQIADLGQPADFDEQTMGQSTPTGGGIPPIPDSESSAQVSNSHPLQQTDGEAPSLEIYNTFDSLPLEELSAAPDEPGPPSPEIEARLMMPSADSIFWEIYSNRLRVNGTVEEFCMVGQRLSRSGSSDSLSKMQPPGCWVP
ncbi:MAG: hypothetical protein Q9163_003693 [Psora crenata]